jgi:hypothetical protein
MARTIPLKDKIESKTEIIGGCWIWQGKKNPKGYGITSFPKGKTVLAHRASYIAFKGDVPEGKMVCHTCDNPSCVNPDHLFLGTAQENTTDMINKGRIHLVVSKEEIKAMRDDFATGEYTKTAIARKYGHNKAYTGMVLRGQLRDVY